MGYDRTVRVTVAILAVMVLSMTGVAIFQSKQIGTLVRVDCQALIEREQRRVLYSDLIDYWESRDATVAASYKRQKAALGGVISASRAEC